MFKVIETAGHDEPWWFFEDWEKMIVSTEEFDKIEDALFAYQALYQKFVFLVNVTFRFFMEL